MARVAVLEKDAADAAQGLETMWAFASRISSIGHRISSRQKELKTYEKQWHHEEIIKIFLIVKNVQEIAIFLKPLLYSFIN